MDSRGNNGDRVPGSGPRVPEEGARPTELVCPECGDPLVHVHTEIASGAFRTQAASMPQMPIHYYDCVECGTCWKFATRLLPDPIRQIVRDTSA